MADVHCVLSYYYNKIILWVSCTCAHWPQPRNTTSTTVTWLLNNNNNVLIIALLLYVIIVRRPRDGGHHHDVDIQGKISFDYFYSLFSYYLRMMLTSMVLLYFIMNAIIMDIILWIITVESTSPAVLFHVRASSDSSRTVSIR